MLKLDIIQLYHDRDKLRIVKEDLLDYLLLQVYSPTVLRLAKSQWDTIPEYIKLQMPDEIQSLMNTPLNTKELQSGIDQYWVKHSVDVLTGYSDCQFPFTKSKRITSFQRNLLSPKGKSTLTKLRHALEKNKISKDMAATAFFASNKTYLDLDLFVDMDYLDKIPLLWRDEKHPLQFPDTHKEMTISMTTGCYNNCSFCAVMGKSDVAHMPFPIFLKMYEILNKPNRPYGDGLLTYSDSDPTSYTDPIIGADSGDVFIHLQQRQNIRNPSFLTKGIAAKKDAITLAKVCESIRMIVFSYSDLPGENAERNMRRIKASQAAIAAVPKSRRQATSNSSIRNYTLDQTKPRSKLEKQFGQYVSFEEISPVGRWNETAKKYNITSVDKNSIHGFTTPHYLVAATGQIFDVYLDETNRRYAFQLVGDIFDKASIESLSKINNTTQMHPTKLRIERYKHLPTRYGNWQNING